MTHKHLRMRPDVALFISRLIIGGIFITSGWLKVTDMATVLSFFSALHIPAFLTYVVAYGELIGGVLLALGLWTRNVTIFLSVIMVCAVYFSIPHGIAVYMTPLAVLGGLIAILGHGSGRYRVGSLD